MTVYEYNRRPAIVNIEHYLGDDFLETITLNLDLTGCSAKFTVKTSRTASTNLAQDTITESGMTIDTGTPSTDVLVLITDAEQATWEAGEYVYDFEITHADGTMRTYLTGKFSVLADVS